MTFSSQTVPGPQMPGPPPPIVWARRGQPAMEVLESGRQTAQRTYKAQPNLMLVVLPDNGAGLHCLAQRHACTEHPLDSYYV